MPADPVPTHDPGRLLAAHAAAVAYYRARLLAAGGPVRYLRGRGLGAVVDAERERRIGARGV